MAGIPFSPPDIVEFCIGMTEQKLDGQVFDKTKQPGYHRIPIKQWNRITNKQAARLALQKSVAHRSSALRQGKFAEARSQNGVNKFAATKAAGVRALMARVFMNRNWVKDSDFARRQSLITRRTDPDRGKNIVNLLVVSAENSNDRIFDLKEK